ncbi:MAG TPA: alpha/beta fold hydrolase [Polyangiaceae bacterium]
MRVALLCLALVPLFDRQCSRSAAEGPDAAAAVQSAAPERNEEGPIRIEALEQPNEPPVYVLRGGPRGPEKIVFLHGMCGHGQGYAEAFQRTAARRGTLIAPQADVPCGNGPWARWSKDLDALDARIVRAFRALGAAEPIEDVIVIGYSQGATRAESLARTFPERYTRLVLMGGPYAAKAQGLEKLRGAVALAGDRDRLDLMQASAKVLKGARVPATFMLIPEATHGSMGAHPEQTMDEVFTWLAEHQRPIAP